ncbi:hypothetical protein [uncultured Ruegeria sp.]|uniref:hypothetical protein n=1 Tax=uncultured Ruegeria sp. TaxID=259304 RepID=UPI00260B1555|nr:hypothetical protein [uncultured Ruegeria sp.]
MFDDRKDCADNQDQLGDQYCPAMTSLANGGYVHSWYNPGFTPSSSCYIAQVNDVDGAIVRPQFILGPGYSNPSIAALSCGGFVATYNGRMTQSGNGIYGQLFTENGELHCLEFSVLPLFFGIHGNSRVTGLVDGGFTVTWASADRGPYADGYYAQRFTKFSLPTGPEFYLGSKVPEHADDVCNLVGGREFKPDFLGLS